MAGTIAESANNGVGLDRDRLRREHHAGACARPRRRGRTAADRQRHPLRRRPRRRHHQSVVRVRAGRSCARTSRTSSTRSATPTARACSWSAPSGNAAAAGGGLSGALGRRAVGRRGHRARLPGRLLQRGHGPGRRRARRRRRRRRSTATSNCRPPSRRGPGHLPDDLHRPQPLRASASRRATSAPRWRRRTWRPPPRSSSPPACSARTRRPAAIERRLERTARDLGPPGADPHYGCGPARRRARRPTPRSRST